ncbi:LOW QUALITY PROTEIN: CD226 antigen [Sphaerodactylus townsendi]|uniref:LOW QUALITY PROTEIN: CD226 antigen n=1 Tax=Sphaerodactylus townsendi TaxID=933632 RepID=UPI002027674F|nr:LOW QUALITY PROTEIN: CD226 antigen [Sphaerodactylus townsendi]
MWSGSGKNLHETPSHLFSALLEMHCFALILISILQTCKGCFSVAEEREIVDSTVKLTNNMTLKCVYPKMAKITQMSWIKSKGKETIAVFKLPHSLHITSIYEGRVNVINHTMNDKSLVFNNTTKADIGLYICSFQSFPHGIWEKKVQVVQAGNFTPPFSAASHVIIEPGKNVTFRCGADLAITMNRVTWERVHDGTVDTVVQCTQLRQSIHGSDYEERVEINCATQANTIVLWNVTESDSGMFRCCYTGASGESGAHWTKLTVTFNVPLVYKQNIIAIAGGSAVGTAILLLMLILSIVATVVHRRKKKRKRIMMPPKALLITERQPFHGQWNASGGENMTASSTKQEAIYVNCSPRQKMRVYQTRT